MFMQRGGGVGLIYYDEASFRGAESYILRSSQDQLRKIQLLSFWLIIEHETLQIQTSSCGRL